MKKFILCLMLLAVWLIVLADVSISTQATGPESGMLAPLSQDATPALNLFALPSVSYILPVDFVRTPYCEAKAVVSAFNIGISTRLGGVPIRAVSILSPSAEYPGYLCHLPYT